MSLEFDNKVSLGHIISAAVFLLAGAGAYADLRGQNAKFSAEIATISKDQTATEGAMASSEIRLRTVEIAQASQTSDLRSIQIGIVEIKAQLNRMQEAKR
jgi:hypothetical protein